MLPYLARRVAALGVVLFAVSVLAFATLQLIPGILLRSSQAWTRARRRSSASAAGLGLDRPAYVQYVRYPRRAITGDLGRSFRSHQPVRTRSSPPGSAPRCSSLR